MIGCLECGHSEHHHEVPSPHRCKAIRCDCLAFRGPNGDKLSLDLWARAESHAKELTELLQALADNTSDFDLVGRFHAKFGLPVRNEATRPRPLDRETMEFRLRFMLEELRETAMAAGFQLDAKLIDRGDAPSMPHIADGLIDLAYVTLGTAHMLNLPWSDLFKEVQRANITKRRAQKKSESSRGSTLDVVKPEGWQAPDIEGVLRRAGWRP